VYARSTTMVADPRAVEEGIAFVRDQVWPSVKDMDGCLGISMLLDRESGKAIITTSWETEEAIAASREPVRSLRERGTEVTGSSDPVVEEWEVASMHRAHNAYPDAYVRTTWSHVAQEDIDSALELYRTGMLPQIEQFEGFASASLLIDRATGRSALSVAFDGREAMENTRAAAQAMREQAEQAGIHVDEMAEFELAHAHLHIPELV
jgi:heme-degrading monooxygenase HmoA